MLFATPTDRLKTNVYAEELVRATQNARATRRQVEILQDELEKNRILVDLKKLQQQGRTKGQAEVLQDELEKNRIHADMKKLCFQQQETAEKLRYAIRQQTTMTGTVTCCCWMLMALVFVFMLWYSWSATNDDVSIVGKY